jgi:microsomal epoxide hydrolase
VLAEKVFSDIRRWSVMPQGGHFAAMEQPEALAAEISAFFGGLC